MHPNQNCLIGGHVASVVRRLLRRAQTHVGLRLRQPVENGRSGSVTRSASKNIYQPDRNCLRASLSPRISDAPSTSWAVLLMARKRKFIVYVATSADGFIARTDGSVDWLNRPQPEGNYGMGSFYRRIDTCVLGRKTYEQSAKFGMAEGYSGKKNYVLSRTLTKVASAKVKVINDNVAAFAQQLRAENGRHIWLVGGAELIASFLDAAEVDEFIIHVIPHMIGEGIPLVSARHRDLPLKLLTCRTFPDGVVRLHYLVESS
jgi:dihydrofolate reductase